MIQEETIPYDTPILVRLLKRAVVFLASLLIALSLFYASGCIQFFLEHNLHLILFFVTAVSIALITLSLIEIGACIYYAVTLSRKSLYFYTIPFAIILAAGILTGIFSQSITILERGL